MKFARILVLLAVCSLATPVFGQLPPTLEPCLHDCELVDDPLLGDVIAGKITYSVFSDNGKCIVIFQLRLKKTATGKFEWVDIDTQLFDSAVNREPFSVADPGDIEGYDGPNEPYILRAKVLYYDAAAEVYKLWQPSPSVLVFQGPRPITARFDRDLMLRNLKAKRPR